MSEIRKEEGVIAETTMPPALSDAPKAKGKKAKAEREELPTALIEVPLGEVDERGYAARHVDAQLTPEQRGSLRRVLRGLVDKGAKMKSGKPVWTSADAIRWMLEQVAT